MATITGELASFVSGLRWESLPPNVRTSAKNNIRDVLGIAIYASHDAPWGPNLASFAIEQGYGATQATVAGYGKRTIPTRAALANGSFSLAYLFEDYHAWGQTRPGAVIVPAALAAAELQGASGKSLIKGVVAGYEVMPRLVKALPRTREGISMGARGLNNTAFFGSFAAAAAAGVILGLDAGQMAMAFGLAAEQTAGTGRSHWEGAWSWRLHGGLAAERGLSAALLVAHGFKGPREVFEGKHNIGEAFALECEPEWFLFSLGQRWAILDSGYKLYSCRLFYHSAIHSVLELQREHGVALEDIEKVTVFLPGVTPIGSDGLTPDNRAEGIPHTAAALDNGYFCIATALLHGQVLPSQFTEDALRDRRVLDIARDRVEIIADPTMKRLTHPSLKEEKSLGSTDSPELKLMRRPCRVRMQLKDGRVLEQEQEYAPGHPLRPVTQPQLVEKFMHLATAVLSLQQARELNDTFEHLEEVDTSRLAALLAPKD